MLKNHVVDGGLKALDGLTYIQKLPRLQHRCYYHRGGHDCYYIMLSAPPAASARTRAEKIVIASRMTLLPTTTNASSMCACHSHLNYWSTSMDSTVTAV